MIDGALDEGAIDVAGGGVDLEAVDLAAAHLVAHHALVGAGIEHGQHATARPHEDVALVLEDDAWRVLVAEAGIALPQQLILVALGRHRYQFAVHGLGVGHTTVAAAPQALAHFVVVLLAPNLRAVLAAQRGGHTVGGHNQHFVGCHHGHHIAGAVEVGVLAIVPLPAQAARLAVEHPQIGVPGTEDHIATIDHRCCLAVVVDVVVLPQQLVPHHVPGLEHLVATLIEDAVNHHAIGHKGPIGLGLPHLTAVLLVEPHQSAVGGGHDHIPLVDRRTREQHRVGLVLPLDLAGVLVQRLGIPQRVAEVDALLVHAQAGENRGIVGIDLVDDDVAGQLVVDLCGR